MQVKGIPSIQSDDTVIDLCTGSECSIPAANYVTNNKQMNGYHAMLIQLFTWKTSTQASGIP